MTIKGNLDFFGSYLHLTIMPTEWCNFRCIYCYEKFFKDKILMPDNVVKSIKEFIKK